MAQARYLGLIGFLAATFAAAAIGSAATFPSVATWYPTLVRPSWTPPNWLFGPVWTTLYVAMAIAAGGRGAARRQPRRGGQLSCMGRSSR